MNKTLGTTLLVLIIVVLAGGIFFAGTVYARTNMMFDWNGNNGYGMMNSNGGMMSGMMNGQGRMMNGYGANTSDLTPLTVEQAKAAAEKYLANLDTSGLAIDEVMIFDNHAYVLIKETDSGLGAFELLVDPISQAAYPEHGPNMMWNLKYSGLNHQFMLKSNNGMMGMMGSYGPEFATPAQVSGEMTITPEQAADYAQTYLDENMAGTVAMTPIPFYGYYTLDFEKDGQIAGMLSVHGYSGQVFLHTWHGALIEAAE
jgi:hypothetical protein